ncbi:hypothetical protein [Umezawaea beigongshangensis]|uniref:hypothetical protein n=1 Tax=Umezawaea beigongshangensis TaxID=2780383 RepID=UPI0018F1C5F6|nr:hypothetical protein [Umezawaea beigongshangensis]
MHTAAWLTRTAQRLVRDVVRDGRAALVADLTALARHDPRAVAELATTLAQPRTDVDVLDRLIGDTEPDAEQLLHLVAREAHRRAHHGDRTPWVRWGERVYQRAKTRRLRAARAGAA